MVLLSSSLKETESRLQTSSSNDVPKGRKMSVSEFLAKADINAEDRLEHSRKLCHSVATQKSYKRKIEKIKYTIDPSLLQYSDL